VYNQTVIKVQTSKIVLLKTTKI